MISRARTFGAPVTEPGGNAARTRSPSPAPGRSVPVTVETRCQTPGCGSGPSSSGTVPAPGGALDRLGGDRVPGAPQEQLGRQGRDGGAPRARGGDADEGRVGRVERGHPLAERVEGVTRELGGGPQGDVGLEDVPLVDVLDRLADRLLVPARARDQAERAERVAG